MNNWQKIMLPGLCLLAFAMTGCGGSDDKDYTPQWISSNPIQGGENFDPASIITYTFDEAPGGTASVELRTAAGVNVPGVTGVGRQNRSITFNPEADLQLDTDYISTLTISGGKVSGPFVINFSTAAAAPKFTEQLKIADMVTPALAEQHAAGTATAHSLNTASGKWLQTRYVDETSGNIVLLATAPGEKAPTSAARVLYGNAGLDGQWQTPDDIAIGWQEPVESLGNNMQRMIEHSAGADGMAFTGDDQIVAYRITLFDPDRTPAWEGMYVGAGDDRIWFTADDKLGAQRSAE